MIQTSVQRPPFGPQSSGHCDDESYKFINGDMTFVEKVVIIRSCLIKSVALAVPDFVHVIIRKWGKIQKKFNMA